MPTNGWAGSGSKLPSRGVRMDMMMHKHMCLIMAMMSCNNTNKNKLTKMPEEVVQQVLSFLHSWQARYFCDLLGAKVKNLASWKCYFCDRQMLYKQIVPRTPYRSYHKCADALECRHVRRKVWRSQAMLALWKSFVAQLMRKEGDD